MKSLLKLFCIVALLAGSSFAQDADAPGQTRKIDPPAVDAVTLERTAVGDAFTLARTTDLSKTPNLNAVEDLLIALNQSKPDSAEWRMETAQRLMHTAEQLARAGKPDNIPQLAGRALQHLGIADTPSRDPETRAAAKTLSAWIYERYLADADSAQASYEAASQLAPGNAKAKEAADRVKNTKDNVQRKPLRGN